MLPVTLATLGHRLSETVPSPLVILGQGADGFCAKHFELLTCHFVIGMLLWGGHRFCLPCFFPMGWLASVREFTGSQNLSPEASSLFELEAASGQFEGRSLGKFCVVTHCSLSF